MDTIKTTADDAKCQEIANIFRRVAHDINKQVYGENYLQDLEDEREREEYRAHVASFSGPL